MPRIKLLKFHVYDGKTLTYSGLGVHPPTDEAEIADWPLNKIKDDDLWQIRTWLDGPRAGEESIVFLGGDNWIPAHWPVSSRQKKDPSNRSY